MAFDYEKLLEQGTDYGLESFLRAITKAAYDQGFQVGVESVKEFQKSLALVTEQMQRLTFNLNEESDQFEKTSVFPIAVFGEPSQPARAFASGEPAAEVETETDREELYPIDYDVPPPPPRKVRVQRGLVQNTVAMALELEPGKSIKEYEALVLELEPEISVKSIGNELRRGEADGRYKRDKPGGMKWYLGSAEIETEEQSSGAPSVSDSNQGGDDDPDNMT